MYILLKLSSKHKNCLQLKPTTDFFFQGAFHHWHCLKLLAHGGDKMQANLPSVLLLFLNSLYTMDFRIVAQRSDCS